MKFTIWIALLTFVLSACGLAQNAAINIGGGIAMDRAFEAANNVEAPETEADRQWEKETHRPRMHKNHEPSEDYCKMYPDYKKCE